MPADNDAMFHGVPITAELAEDFRLGASPWSYLWSASNDEDETD